MKVLLINGSPRANGCTYTALCEAGKTINATGIETEIIQIGAKPIQGCTACGRCAKEGLCVFDDLANDIIRAMDESDGLIVGSPVYYGAPNGSLLALLDRVFYAGSRRFAHKPGAALVSARRAGTTAALEVLNKYFMLCNMPLISSQYWNMVHGNTPEEVAQDLEGLQTMRTLGANMAWLLRCIEVGQRAGVDRPALEPRERTNFIR